MAGPLLVIVGPTAAGKSAVGIALAKSLGGEVVSADSMQVYRGFDIGTGKVTDVERQGVSHHLIDVCDAHERFSAARFVREADRAIAGIHERGLLPVVVGGTGLYVKALLTGLFDAPDADPQLRERHGRIRDELGLEALYQQLHEVDPETARMVHPNDFVRISRALEVYEQTGEPISALRARHAFGARRHSAVIVSVTVEPGDLRTRIEARIDAMIVEGWLEEVRALIARGYGDSHPMGALGYRQLATHLGGEYSLEEAVRLTKRDTWRFSRRQRNWFAQQGETIVMEAGESLDPQYVRSVLDQHDE